MRARLSINRSFFIRVQESRDITKQQTSSRYYRKKAGRNPLICPGGLFCLGPNVGNLVLYLGDFLEVSASFMVRYLGFEFVDFLLVLPVRQERERKRSGELLSIQVIINVMRYTPPAVETAQSKQESNKNPTHFESVTSTSFCCCFFAMVGWCVRLGTEVWCFFNRENWLALGQLPMLMFFFAFWFYEQMKISFFVHKEEKTGYEKDLVGEKDRIKTCDWIGF